MRPPSRHRLAAAIGLAVVGWSAVACSDEQAGDQEAFCADVGVNRDAIVAPRLRSQADIDTHLAIYRQLAETAPLAIEEDWDALVAAYETMSTVDPDDAESEQRALAEIYAAQPSAVAVHDWVLATCEVDLGPLATVPGAPPVAAGVPTTTPTTATTATG